MFYSPIMTDTLLQKDIDNIGIDSYRRLAVLCHFLLRKAYTNTERENFDSKLQDRFKIVKTKIRETETNSRGGITSTSYGNLQLVAKLTVSDDHLVNGGNILNSIIPQQTTAFSPDINNSLRSTDDGTRTTINLPNVNSLEQLLFWSYQNIVKEDLSTREFTKNERFTDKNNTNDIELQFNIRFNLQHYLTSNNVLEAIGIINTDELPDDGSDNSNNETSFFSNNSFLGNNSFFGN